MRGVGYELRAKCALYVRMTREFWGITEISCMSAVHTFCKG
jgi:hypothetical protein